MKSIVQTATLHNPAARADASTQVRRFPPLRVADTGRVRIGGQGPIFRSAVADLGRVRTGGQGPIFRSAIADLGRVRIGGQGPIFR